MRGSGGDERAESGDVGITTHPLEQPLSAGPEAPDRTADGGTDVLVSGTTIAMEQEQQGALVVSEAPERPTNAILDLV